MITINFFQKDCKVQYRLALVIDQMHLESFKFLTKNTSFLFLTRSHSTFTITVERIKTEDGKVIRRIARYTNISNNFVKPYLNLK